MSLYAPSLSLPLYTCGAGVDFYSRALVINDQTIALQFWDTAGQER